MKKILAISILLSIKGYSQEYQNLREKLEKIYNEDQGNRKKTDSLATKYGWNSIELRDHWKKISMIDSVNFITVSHIIDQYGWIGNGKIGKEAMSALFLVIQHAKPVQQKKYLPVLKSASTQGELSASAVAMLEDRIAMSDGKKQIYGTQLQRDEKGKIIIYPIEDPFNVDQKRSAVGLEPIAEYLMNWNLKWDAQEHFEYSKTFILKGYN